MRYCIVFLFLLIQSSISAQFAFWHKNEDGIEALKKSILVVELLEENPKLTKKWTPEQKEAYSKRINRNNTLIKEVFPQTWTLQKKIAFKTRSEIKEFLKTPEKNEAIFFLYEAGERHIPSAGPDPFFYWVSLPMSKFEKHKNVIDLLMGYRAETKDEWRFVIYNLNKYLKAYGEGKKVRDLSLYDPEKNFKKLQDKTLLVDSFMLDTESLSYSEALKIYPHKGKLQFANIVEIMTAVEEKKSDVMYMTYLLNEQHNLWMHAIVDPVTMDVVAMQPPNRVYFGIGRQFSTGSSSTTEGYRRRSSSIWADRKVLQLNAGDFQFLGQKVTIEKNYFNPLTYEGD